MSNILRALTGAESEVERLEREVARWTAKSASCRTELQELERRSGSAVTAEDPVGAVRELATQAQELRIWIDGAQGAAQAAQERLVTARWDLDEARAAEMRDKAAKLTVIAEAHDEKVAALLGQLRELDGVEYVPFAPDAVDQNTSLMNGGSVSWANPQSWLLWDPVQPLLDEAAAIMSRVAGERQAAARLVTPVVASAEVSVPEWDDMDGMSTIGCRVSEGVGSVTFEVSCSGQHGGTELVTLPDAKGGRGWSKRVKLSAGGGSASVRVDGKVLAREVRPGSLLSDGIAKMWVDQALCPGCRQLAPVLKRGKSPTQNRADGPVEALACQHGCGDGKRLQAA